MGPEPGRAEIGTDSGIRAVSGTGADGSGPASGRAASRRESRTQARRRARRPTGRNAWTRVRALLAGGLVLGVGTTLTLAAWTDSEYSAGTYTASVFGIEGSTGGVFAEHATTGTAAAMSFDAGAMSPGAVAYGFLDVRTTAASTVGGTAALTESVPTGSTLITNNLVYRVAVVPAGTACSGAAYGGSDTGAGSVFAGASGPLGSAAQDTVRFCFRVTMAAGTPSTAQGQSGTITWRVTGTSS